MAQVQYENPSSKRDFRVSDKVYFRFEGHVQPVRITSIEIDEAKDDGDRRCIVQTGCAQRHIPYERSDDIRRGTARGARASIRRAGNDPEGKEPRGEK
jgi:hypothetical protein